MVAQHPPREWADTNPFYLLIVPDEGEFVEIDLGESGWLTKHADLLRVPGRWHLVHKATNQIPAMILVREGEQPYYVARHVGTTNVMSGVNSETTIYGIGKKKLDGTVDRIWLMANGVATVGDDMEDIALMFIRAGHL